MARLAAMVVVLVAAVAVAVQGQTCSVGSNGYVFDLSKANSGNDISVTMASTGYTALINSCKGLSTTDPVVCNTGTMACQKTGSTAFKAMAKARTTAVASSANSIVVTYDNGDYCPTPMINRRVVITYTCSTTGNTLTYINENPSCVYNFNWATPAGCGVAGTVAPTGAPGGGGSSGGLSGGDVFLIIFFVGGFLYVAVGMAYMYKFKGQTGVEMVPNIQFWRDLPGLLKDGFVYTGQKISGLFQKN